MPNQAQGSELVFLPFAVFLVERAAPAVEKCSSKRMAAFAAIELHQNTSPVGLIIDVAQQI